MSDEKWEPYTWETCIERYKRLKDIEGDLTPESHNHEAAHYWTQVADGMLNLIEAIREDTSFPEVTKLISHATLRLGLTENDPASWLNVWISWVTDEQYSVGIGMFGHHEQVIVPRNQIILVIKNYLQRLRNLSQTYQSRLESLHITPENRWTKEALDEEYSLLPPEWLMSQMFFHIQERLSPARMLQERLENDPRWRYAKYMITDKETQLNILLETVEEILKLADSTIEDIISITQTASEIDIKHRSKAYIEKTN